MRCVILCSLMLGSHTHQALNTRLDSASYSASPLSKVNRRLFILLTNFHRSGLMLLSAEIMTHLLVKIWPMVFDARLHEDVHW